MKQVTKKAILVLYKIEKEVFFLTNVKLPLLKRAWRRNGHKIQARLNAEHKTNIIYGYYA